MQQFIADYSINGKAMRHEFNVPDDRARHAKIDDLEAQMRAAGPTFIPETLHHFAPGLYAREIRIPAGVTVTGKIHKHSNLNIMSAGRLTLWDEDGELVHLEAPYTVVAPAGVRRVVYAHTDVVWTTIHATPETDLAMIEREFVVSTYEQYLAYCEQLKLEEK